MVIPAVLVAMALFYAMIYYTDAIPPSEREKIWSGAYFASGFFLLFMIPMFTLAGWMQKRSEPTRMQVEMREREQAKRLLTKYPDLRD